MIERQHGRPTVSRVRKARWDSALAWAWTLALLEARPAQACPDCWVGRRARQWVFGDHFLHYLMAAVLPFLLVAALSALAGTLGRETGPRGDQVKR